MGQTVSLHLYGGWWKSLTRLPAQRLALWIDRCWDCNQQTWNRYLTHVSKGKVLKTMFFLGGPKSLWMFLFKKDVIPKNHSSDPSATDIQQCSNYWSFRPLDQWPDYQTMCPGWNHQACGSTTVLITLQMKCARSTVSGNLFQCLAYLFVRANNLAGGFN